MDHVQILQHIFTALDNHSSLSPMDVVISSTYWDIPIPENFNGYAVTAQQIDGRTIIHFDSIEFSTDYNCMVSSFENSLLFTLSNCQPGIKNSILAKGLNMIDNYRQKASPIDTKHSEEQYYFGQVLRSLVAWPFPVENTSVEAICQKTDELRENYRAQILNELEAILYQLSEKGTLIEGELTGPEKVTFLYELGILDAIAQQCKHKSGRGFDHAKASEIISKFTGINKHTLRRNLLDIYSEYPGLKNDVTNTGKNKTKIHEMMVTYQLTKISSSK